MTSINNYIRENVLKALRNTSNERVLYEPLSFISKVMRAWDLICYGWQSDSSQPILIEQRIIGRQFHAKPIESIDVRTLKTDRVSFIERQNVDR